MWWINPGGFWKRWCDLSQDRIIGSSALNKKREQGIQWQTNGPPRSLRYLSLYKAWSTSGPFTGVVWPLEAAASIHWQRLPGKCQKTNELKEETRRSGSGPRGATLHHSVNYQSRRLTEGKGEFGTQERSALEVQHHLCLPSAAWLHWNNSSVTPSGGRVVGALGLPFFTHTYKHDDDSY